MQIVKQYKLYFFIYKISKILAIIDDLYILIYMILRVGKKKLKLAFVIYNINSMLFFNYCKNNI